MSEQVRPGFAEFVAARYEALARSAYLLTGDRGLAEDAVQSALVRRCESGTASTRPTHTSAPCWFG